MWKNLVSVMTGRMMAGCGKVENDVLKNVWKMGMFFL